MGYSYQELKGKIIGKFGSQEEFAKEIGISQNALSKKLTGKTGISQRDIVKWSELLEISEDEYGKYFFA